MKVPAFDHLRAERVVLLPRAVHPVDGGGLREPGHLLDPLEQVVVLAQRDRRVASRPRGTGLVRAGVLSLGRVLISLAPSRRVGDSYSP